MRSSRSWFAVLACAFLALGVGACGSSSSDSKSSGSSGSSSGGAGINGAGSTFAAPIYQQWGATLKDQGVTVNYQPVGSGAGVAQFTNATADFGATDPPMKDEEIAAAKAKGKPLHFPTGFGAITVSYNLAGVQAGLKLDGKTIANIFLGKISKWNDPAIAKQNPGVKLPSSSITVIHRSDESGTTKGFTTFLSASSPEWKTKVGADKTVKWPTGTGGKGNDGVAAAVKQQQNSVGYVEEAFALQNKFTTAEVKNSSGSYVAPTLASTTAAGEGVKVPPDLRFTIIDSPNATAYPIASQTFVVVYQDPCKAGIKPDAAKGIAKFLEYGLGAGQDALATLQYAKLPPAVDTKAKAQLKKLTCNGSPLGG